MKRFDLREYFELAEMVERARVACSRDETEVGLIYMATFALAGKVRKFADDDSGFQTSKHSARDLFESIMAFSSQHATDDGSPPTLAIEKFDNKVASWQYSDISTKLDAFRTNLSTECRDVEIYSVGQVGIYKTSELVSNGARQIADEYKEYLPPMCLDEFDSAGRCLGFDLPTACGFHALRAVELAILHYLESLGVAGTKKLKTWNEYVKAIIKLSEDDEAKLKPSPKVEAMVDRMRDLDRNPLMHPRDTLDTTSANMLFQLSALTVSELARDLKKHGKGKTVSDLVKALAAVPETAA